ncbi:hypothetical protein [Chryseobacterium koreense]|uniref:lipase family protein n=1 Tax=Chryseobacterium koreense TaxID=232216 RepID=UPI0026F296A6|nr:hypothetical protein [Chryseobacterium koreense]
MLKFNKIICAIFFAGLLISCSSSHFNQRVKEGYDPKELLALMPALERTYDSVDIAGFKTPEPKGMERVFRSKVTPLKNRFDVWRTSEKSAAITFRGTILDEKSLSFSAAFYYLMTPANGKIKLGESKWFEYKLSEVPGSGVHLGILLGLGLLSEELVAQIENQHKQGIRDIILVGHSQGSGISILATAYLKYLQKEGKLPMDINFKTYSVATPKIANFAFVCNYENLTRNYAFSVDSPLDWVPSIGITFQSVNDFPPVSIFKDFKSFMSSIGYMPGKNYDSVYQQVSTDVPNLTKMMHNIVKENVYPRILEVLPGYEEPEIMNSYNFERAGTHISLIPSEQYYKIFPNNPDNYQVWENHSVYPYYILLKED